MVRMRAALCLSLGVLAGLSACAADECRSDTECASGEACYKGACVRAYALQPDATTPPADAAAPDAIAVTPDAQGTDATPEPDAEVSKDAEPDDLGPPPRDGGMRRDGMVTAPDTGADAGEPDGGALPQYPVTFTEPNAISGYRVEPGASVFVGSLPAMGAAGRAAFAPNGFELAVSTPPGSYQVMDFNGGVQGPFTGVEPEYEPGGSIASVDADNVCVLAVAAASNLCYGLQQGLLRKPRWDLLSTAIYTLADQGLSDDPHLIQAQLTPVPTISVVSANVLDFDVASNGDLVVLVRSGGNMCVLATGLPSGSNNRALATGVPCDAHIDQSPDDLVVAVGVELGPSNHELYLVPTGQAAPIALSSLPAQVLPWPVGGYDWTPDSRYVMVSVDEGNAGQPGWSLYFSGGIMGGSRALWVGATGSGAFRAGP